MDATGEDGTACTLDGGSARVPKEAGAEASAAPIRSGIEDSEATKTPTVVTTGSGELLDTRITGETIDGGRDDAERAQLFRPSKLSAGRGVCEFAKT
jgi:hypothetical protein